MDYELRHFRKIPKETLHQLFEEGYDVNYQYADGSTLLHYACHNQVEDEVEILLQNGASVALTNKRGNTPLHYASKRNNSKIVELLLDYAGQNVCNIINVKNDKGGTPLQNAIDYGQLDNVKNLLMYGAGYNIEKGEGDTLFRIVNKEINDLIMKIDDLFVVLENDSYEFITKFMDLSDEELNIIINVCNKDGQTLLQIAFAKRDVDLICRLIKINTYRRFLNTEIIKSLLVS